MAMGGSTSYVPMVILAFGVMIAKKNLDMTQAFVMLYLFCFIMSTLGLLPAIVMHFTDG